MLADERAIGNYLEAQDCSLVMSADQRERMVTLIQGLHRKRGYRLETLFLAVSIADRYLRNLGGRGKRAPCLVLLAVTSLLLAAKLNEALRPAFINMNRLLHSDFGVFVKKQEFTDLESDILTSLEFSLQWVSPITFLERLQRVFGLDQEEADEASSYVGNLARKFCLKMQKDASFLQYKPSQMAAASLTLAVRTHFDRKVAKTLVGSRDLQYQVYDEMKMWTSNIEKITGVSVENDLRPVYRLLRKEVQACTSRDFD